MFRLSSFSSLLKLGNFLNINLLLCIFLFSKFDHSLKHSLLVFNILHRHAVHTLEVLVDELIDILLETAVIWTQSLAIGSLIMV